MSFDYSVFGLNLRSDLPIPGLKVGPVSKQIEIQVWFRQPSPWPSVVRRGCQQEWYAPPHRDSNGFQGLRTWRSTKGELYRLRFSDGVEFVLDRAGRQIWSAWPAHGSLEDTAVYLMGTAIGFALRLRGIQILHASAVAVGGIAVGIMGGGGAGKSTTAAAFSQLGYPILSDDIMAVNQRLRVSWVQPAIPRLGLWPESVEMLFGSREALPRFVVNWDKRYLELDQNAYRFQAQPLPLGVVYVLGPRSFDPRAPYLEAMGGHAALMSLVEHTYMRYLLDKPMRARALRSLARIAAKIPIRRLVPHHDPNLLPKLCDLILDDLSSLALADSSLALTTRFASVWKAPA